VLFVFLCSLLFQKNAIAVAHCKRAKSKDKGGVINVNGYPIDGLLPESMRYKVFEPILLVGNDKFKEVDIRVRVRGGGNVSQIFGEYLVAICLYFLSRPCLVSKIK
jgi:ribosomal protein S9